MKHIFLVIFTLGFFSCATKNSTSFIVEGAVKNNTAKIIYLEQAPENREHPLIIDSATIGKDGSFTLKGTGDEEGLYDLRTGQSQFPFAIFINDSKKIRIDADLSKRNDVYRVSGSNASLALVDFEKKYVSQMQLMDQLANEYRRLSTVKPNDSLSLATIDSLKRTDSVQYENTGRYLKEYAKSLIDKSTSAAFTMYVLYFFAPDPGNPKTVEFSPTEMFDIIAKASSKFPSNTALADWKKTLRSNKAPDFALPDTAGRTVSLSSFKGKYVLVDFWASWCKPCRMENPNVVAAYHQFKDTNFAILGVSLDDNKQAWLKAIHNDGLAWNQVSDLKGWNSEAAALYGVQSIPYNFLIDPNGNIVAENIRGKQLFDALKKVLK